MSKAHNLSVRTWHPNDKSASDKKSCLALQGAFVPFGRRDCILSKPAPFPKRFLHSAGGKHRDSGVMIPQPSALFMSYFSSCKGSHLGSPQLCLLRMKVCMSNLQPHSSVVIGPHHPSSSSSPLSLSSSRHDARPLH